MEYGICNLSVIPVRAEPSDKSEIVTQLLFGEHFSITSKKQQWRKIKNAFDEYEGWIDEKQLISISEEQFKKLEEIPLTTTLDLMQIVISNNNMVPLLIGSNLPFYENGSCTIGDQTLKYDGHTRTFSTDLNKNHIIDNSFTYLNSPYLWGGKSPFGIDCSGFTQMVYKLSGIKLKRDASQQATQGYALNFLEEAEPGDLAFFDNAEGKIIHVGIILHGNQIIHASGKVRIDNLDHHGIFNVETNKYSHKLRVLKRII